MEKTEMEFPHQNITLVAAYPFFGPANSKTLQTEIKNAKYSEPAFPELTSFIHHYYNEKKPHADEVNEIMWTKYFVGFTGILYVPKRKEVCFFDHPKFDGGSVVDIEDMLTRLRLNEKCKRVSLENIEVGSVPWNKIEQNPLFIALGGGEEGAGKIAMLASRHPDKKVHIFIPEMSNFTSPQARVTLLYSYDNGKSLTISLNGAGYSINSFAVGLVNT